MATPLAVLIVEDSDSDAQLIRRLLEKAGYEITAQVVADAAQMCAALEKQTWDIVISDYSLPQFDGPAALALVQETGADIPFIVVSGTMGEVTAVAMMKAGAHDYLMKDHLARLAPVVARELGEAETRRERKQAEKALRETQQNLAVAIHSANIGLWDWDLQTNKVTFSREWKSQLGFSEGEIADDFSEWESRIHADDVARAKTTVNTFLAKPYPNFQNEFRMRHKDGSYRWILAQASVLTDEQGKPMRMIGSHIDITERKRAEENLRESEANLLTLIENTKDIIVSRDCAGRAIVFNSSFAHIVRTLFSAEARPGIRTMDYMATAQKAHWENVLSQVLEGESHREEFAWQVGGQTRYYELSLTPIRVGGKIIGTTEFTRDITERKRAEDALSQTFSELQTHQAELQMQNEELRRAHQELDASREKYFELYDLAPTGYITLNASGMILEANLTAANLLGVARSALIHQPLTHFVYKQDQDINYAHYKRLVETRAPQTCELRIVRRDGALRWVSIEATVRQNSDGVLEFWETLSDITDRKQADSALVLAHERLSLAQRSANAGVWDWDMTTGQLTWSPEFYNLFGLDPAIVAPTFDTWRAALHPQDLERAEAQIDQAVREHIPLANAYRIIKPPSQVRWISALGNTTYDEQGQAQRMTGICIDITERKKYEREIESMASVSAALRTAITCDEMFPVIAEQISHLLNAPSVAIGLIVPNEDASVVLCANGGWAETVGMRIPLEHSISGYVLTTGKSYITHDLAHDSLLHLPHYTGELQSGACVPLIAQGEAIGWVFVGVLTTLPDEDVRILNVIADIAANAIRRVTLFEQTKKYVADLRLAYETTLEGWVCALELRDQETEGHSRRVVQTTLELARVLGIDESNIEHIRRGALLHDIGKMAIPDSILLKPGTLNEREWEIMRQHPMHAYQLLLPIEHLRPAVDIPYCHHEKWDGTGYPRGLKGEAIPLAARIFAIVDVWDALSYKRPYRLAWQTDQILNYLRANAGSHFDPRLVSVFLEWIGQREQNSMVETD